MVERINRTQQTFTLPRELVKMIPDGEQSGYVEACLMLCLMKSKEDAKFKRELESLIRQRTESMHRQWFKDE